MENKSNFCQRLTIFPNKLQSQSKYGSKKETRKEKKRSETLAVNEDKTKQ